MKIFSFPISPNYINNSQNKRGQSLPLRPAQDCFVKSKIPAFKGLSGSSEEKREKYIDQNTAKLLDKCKNSDGSMNEKVVEKVKKLFGKIYDYKKYMPDYAGMLLDVCKKENGEFQTEMIDIASSFYEHKNNVTPYVLSHSIFPNAKEKDGTFNNSAYELLCALNARYYYLDTDYQSASAACKDNSGNFNPKALKFVSECLNSHIEFYSSTKCDFKKILDVCKNQDGQFSDEALDFARRKIVEFNDRGSVNGDFSDHIFIKETKNILTNSKDNKGNFVPKLAEYLSKTFRPEYFTNNEQMGNIEEIMKLFCNDGKFDQKTAAFVANLSHHDVKLLFIKSILQKVKKDFGTPLNEKLVERFNDLSSYYAKHKPTFEFEDSIPAFCASIDEKTGEFDEDKFAIYDKLTSLKNINHVGAEAVLKQLENNDGRLNKLAAKELTKFLKFPVIEEDLGLVLSKIAMCINDKENNKVNEENFEFIKSMLEKGFKSPDKVIETFYNENNQFFDLEGAKLFFELLDEAKNHKQELRPAVEDLSDDELEEFFTNNIRNISKAASLAGKNALISAFSMKLDNFDDIISSIGPLCGTLEENGEQQQLIRITNPENSYRYKVYKNNIKYYKEIIKNSKTPEQKRLEDENNKKIKLLNDKISALKKELSQKTIDSAKTPELKKEIKEKTAQIKDLHAQTQQFLKESLSDEVKKAIEKVNRLNNECKKLLQDSIQDPQEIIQKLVILSATYNGYDNQFFEDFLKKMNPKTPQEKEEFNKLVSKKLYDFLDCKYDKKTAERLNLEHSRYFASLFLTGDDFKENFGILFDLLKKHPDESIREIMDSLDRNIHTCLALEKRGINYTRWANADKNSYIKVKIETDVDKAQKSAVLNLEKDFNDPAFDQIPEEARKNLVKALKNAGIELLDKKEINYDADGFSDGEKTVRRLYCGGEPIKFEQLGTAIEAIKEHMNKDNFWNTTASGQKVENARTTLLNHILKLRSNDYKNARNMKSDSEVELEVHQTDMNNISHALFLGNHAGCCTAVGTGINDWSAPAYIMNKCISGIEVMDGKDFAGNTMCYIADVDGEEALVLDNIELSTKYQYNDAIRDAIIEYAKKLTAEIGRPDLPIYAGPFRHKVDFKNFDCNFYDVKILGSTGDDEVYIDFLTDGMTIDGEKSECTKLYRIR